MVSLPALERKAFLASLTKQEATELNYRWDFWARDNQLAPAGDWYLWLVLSGRGFGKTRMGAEWVRARVESGKYRRIALLGQTAADVRDVMVEGESGILAVSSPWCYPRYEPSKRRIVWPNGAVATTYSGDEPDQLRGPQHDTAWADEPAKFRYLEECWANLEMGLRLGDDPRIVATTTPRPIKWIKEAVLDPQTVVTRGRTLDNAGNVNPKFLERVRKKYEGTRIGRQELDGEILDDNPNALWNRVNLDAHRVRSKDVPQLQRIVVAVDPQAADNDDGSKPRKGRPKESDGSETGIIVAGITSGSDPHAFVLEDCSLRDSPNEWGSAAVAAYVRHKADRIVAEVNNGGAMVEFTIATVARDKKVNAAYRAVHASRGKYTRAEPIAAFYEQGRVHHVGRFATLEDQLCEWQPGMDSPDRLDALVWALTDLMTPPAETSYRPMMAGGKRII